jgi:uncharacterized protein YrrD
VGGFQGGSYSLRKARDVIGLPVISVETGKQVGHAKDLLITESWNIQGIALEIKHWFSSMRYIAWEDVIACGTDAVTIPNENVVQSLEDANPHMALNTGKHKLKGLPVITVNGQQLGLVEDVYLEPNVGKQIVGYELSEGFISDLKDGRRWLPMPQTATKGEDAIVVPVHCIEELEEIFVSKEE